MTTSISPTPLPTPERVLAIGAHPDDIEFGCGGTLAKWAAAGADIHFLVLTDGSKGSWDVGDDLSALVHTRRAEALDAARTLGNGTVHFGDFVDGELESDEAGRLVVCRTIREVRPDVVIGHDPWKRYRLHPDHRHAGWITVDGLVAARDPHFFPGVGGHHHRPELLMLFEADEPDHVEPIEETIATKVAALVCHRSQWLSTMGIDPVAGDQPGEHRAFARRVAERARVSGSAQLGEEFRLLRDL